MHLMQINHTMNSSQNRLPVIFDIKLPIWPTKLLVPIVLAVLWVRLVLQALDYGRLIGHPDAAPIAVPVIETIEVQAKNEIEEALGREQRDEEKRS